MFNIAECCKRLNDFAQVCRILSQSAKLSEFFLNFLSIWVVRMRKGIYEPNMIPWLHFAHFWPTKMNVI